MDDDYLVVTGHLGDLPGGNLHVLSLVGRRHRLAAPQEGVPSEGNHDTDYVSLDRPRVREGGPPHARR